MKKIIIIFAVLVLTSSAMPREINALLFMPNSYGANYYIARDNFERLGWNITLTAINQTVNPCQAYAGTLGCPSITVDKKMSEITDITQYDCLVLMFATKWMSTPPFNEILGNQQALNFFRSAADNGLVIATWCSGVRVLAAANIISGRRVTGASEYQQEYTAAGAIYVGNNSPPIIDGNIVTATAGQSYNISAIEAIALAIEQLKGDVSQPPATGSAMISMDSDLAATGVIWEKSVGTAAAEGARSVMQTADGGFIMTGYTYENTNFHPDIFLTRLDAAGNLLWTRTFGGNKQDFGNAVIQTADGGYVIAGFTTSFGAGMEDVYIIKTDQEGNEQWAKTFGGAKSDAAMSVLEADAGVFMVAGFTNSSGAGRDDAYVIKIDAEGNEIWSKTFGGNQQDRINALCQTNDGNYILAGLTG
ncbi:DJ-1/PfpI family protein, partial [candidate division KSB1 bacterium]|nr:DJ-1/PfpI family protein [candidate division KSB1 bacterium]